MDKQSQYFCPRLADYIVLVGSRHPNTSNSVTQTPELLRRYPVEDHKDFALPADVVFFCQPEGCSSIGPKRVSVRETASFVFSLTEKDSARVRYGICVNFYRPFEYRAPRDDTITNDHHSPRGRKSQTRVRNHSLTSLCLISHHPFFSTFRELINILRRIIDACHERSVSRRTSGGGRWHRDTVWSTLTGQCPDNAPNLAVHEVREIETWILRLLSAPVPVPGKTKVELQVLPEPSALIFALPDHTRLSLVDFPLHLPLELLGVETCIKVLTCIILEHKIVLMSRDYNALTMSVMAFVSMLYPLEYMFPVIPLLPTCMRSAEQLLLAPTPYIIGVPASFFLYKPNFTMPSDVWLVDLDANRVNSPPGADDLPPLPEPEATALKNHLRQALASMSVSPQPIKNLDAMTNHHEFSRRDSFTSSMGFNPLIYGNDVDSVDVATRVAMVRFFNSPNTLANFSEHTRTIRLYPRPVVAFQFHSFMKSRNVKTPFTAKLAKTQAVEYFAEFSLSPNNVVFLRVQTGVFDPSLIGDKARWFAHTLQSIPFCVYGEDTCSLGAAIMAKLNPGKRDETDSYPTDESGDDSDGASTSSSYSSLGDYVADMINSDINGDTPIAGKRQVIYADENRIFSPPEQLYLPESTNSGRGTTPEYDDDSSSSESEPEVHERSEPVTFRYDSGNEVSAVVTQDESNEISSEAKRRLQLKNSDPDSIRTSMSQPSTPQMRRHLTVNTGDKPSVSQPTTPTSSKTPTFKLPDAEKTASSFMSALSFGSIGLAHQASSTISGIFRSSTQQASPAQSPSSPSSPTTAVAKRPFAPLGNRKALVEKSGLVKHTQPKKSSIPRNSSQEKLNIHSDNQQFLKDIVVSVHDGQGVGWLKVGRLKRLMEDENYRNFVGSRLNKALDKKLTDEDIHIEDVCVTRSVFKGMLTVLRAMVLGLETTYRQQGIGGMASVFIILEMAHSHYWSRDPNSSNRSDSSMSQSSSPFESQESLSSKAARPSLAEDTLMSVMRTKPRDMNADPRGLPTSASSVMLNGAEGFEDLKSEHRKLSMDVYPNPHMDGGSGDGDIMRELVKNKDLIRGAQRRNLLEKLGSFESETSEGTMLSASDAGDGTGRRRSRINHQGIRGATDTDSDNSLYLSRKRPSTVSIYNTKSSFSTGYRYHDGKLVSAGGLTTPEPAKTYLFEGLLGKERSLLWDQMQFWEDAFLDQTAQERDIIGMDQGPPEMIERYLSLGEVEKKRLEHDEDRLLSIILYNMISFMTMLQVLKPEIKKKIRRLLGKSHIGLVHSSEINELLDHLTNLNGNDIDLKPMCSRLMQKHCFTVHWGQDNSGDMLFMEVCDDCIILRSVTGTICDRWWYEKLINMTYCPKTKVLCLWRRHEGHTQLNKFYTKKCKELYYCVKESMERAAARNNGKASGPDLGGEFPVQDMKTGQGGLLQVCMEGIGILFQNSKMFIHLGHIKKCYTQKGSVFIIEEFDHKERKLIVRKYKSNMADQIAYAVLCVFSYVAAGQDQQNHNSSRKSSMNDGGDGVETGQNEGDGSTVVRGDDTNTSPGDGTTGKSADSEKEDGTKTNTESNN